MWNANLKSFAWLILTFMLREVHLVFCATMYCAADLEMFEFKYLDIFFVCCLVCGVCCQWTQKNKQT